ATVLDAPAVPVEADDAPVVEPEMSRDAIPCPVCLGHGWFAFQPPTDPRTQTCERCYGHGQVLTGSHVPAHMTRECPDCEGRGYGEVEPQLVASAATRAEIEPASEPTATNGPVVETNLAVTEFPRRTTTA